MNKTVDEEIKQIFKRMQNNRQRWRREIKKTAEDEFEKQLKRMRFKRGLLTENENSTPENWDALADEYEELEFMANAASCRVRAKQMREKVVEDGS
jgi:hypothetical protein